MMEGKRYRIIDGYECTPGQVESIREFFLRTEKRKSTSRKFIHAHYFWFSQEGHFLGIYEEMK